MQAGAVPENNSALRPDQSEFVFLIKKTQKRLAPQL
jgi:hypothetical protein